MSEENETKPDNERTTPTAEPGNKAEPAEVEEVPEETKNSTEMIDKANEAAARLERANVEHSKIVSREEALKVKETLGGKAEAGAPPAEESAVDYVKKVMANELETKGA